MVEKGRFEIFWTTWDSINVDRLFSLCEIIHKIVQVQIGCIYVSYDSYSVSIYKMGVNSKYEKSGFQYY
jgi:hypothetical protein